MVGKAKKEDMCEGFEAFFFTFEQQFLTIKS